MAASTQLTLYRTTKDASGELNELFSQAFLILGSTDFWGNPLGFLNGVSEGVSGFMSEQGR
jgi:hypothetical protein